MICMSPKNDLSVVLGLISRALHTYFNGHKHLDTEKKYPSKN